MKRLLLASLLFGIFAVSAEAETPKSSTVLYVQSAHAGSYDGTYLTLKAVPNTVYFTDRPERKAGHISNHEFARSWDGDGDTFRTNPPNADLSILGEPVKNIVLILEERPRLERRGLRYKVTIIEGEIPARFGTASLFIDSTVSPQITD